MTVLLIIDDCTSHCSNVINFKQRAIEYVIGIKKTTDENNLCNDSKMWLLLCRLIIL